jgi:3-methyladenine DNA glycosylase AlkD
MERIMTSQQAKEKLASFAEPERIPDLQRFFKTKKGEYAEGDIFIGVRVPNIRKCAKALQHLALAELKNLLQSPIHEERQLALFILVMQFNNGSEQQRQQIFNSYIKHRKYINNWDLIDVTARHIVGAWLTYKQDYSLLYQYAHSPDMWERRIAILSTFTLISERHFEVSLHIAEIVVNDTEDLIQKAAGWMLREIGNRDKATEVEFLKKHYRSMPRTMLRYAIEKFPETERKKYITGMI